MRDDRDQGAEDHVDAEVDDDFDPSDCVCFIEKVRLESPHCLAGLVPEDVLRHTATDSAALHEDLPDPAAAAASLSRHWLSAEGDFPAQIGRFQILQKLGEGGFGLVFLAFDPRLDRQVALKVPRIETLVTEETRHRFLREGKAAARLDHANIATIHEAGQVGPICYIVSAYCRGRSLADVLKSSASPPRSEGTDGPQSGKPDKALSFASSASLVLALSRGVQHAHDRGILHRDLKPSNILFEFQLDTSRDQQPGSVDKKQLIPRGADLSAAARIVDFGLAKALDEEEERTRTGMTLGTASYMSPEQARGDKSRIGPATDIYSLGAILYELLTRQPPFRRQSHVETIIAVKNELPAAPRRLEPSCPRDLAAICLKCLEKDPARRYASADLLAADLQRYLNGDTVGARSPSLVHRGWRWCLRYPLAAALGTLIVALAIVGPLTALNQRRLYQNAEQARDEVGKALYTSDMNLALRDWEEANIERCGILLKRHLPQPGRPDYRGFEWFYLWRLWQASVKTPVILHDDQLETIALSPDEKLLAVGRQDGAIFLWDLDTGRKAGQWQAHPYHAFSVRFSADGTKLASANIDNEIKLWDVATQRELARLEGSRSVAFAATDGTVAYRADSAIGILAPGANSPRLIPDAHEQGVGCVVFSPDGHRVASAGWKGGIRIWDTTSEEQHSEMAGHTSAIWSMDWSPDGKYIATGDVNGTMKLWNASTCSQLWSVDGHSATVNSLAFSGDSTVLASASVDNTASLWKLANGSRLRLLRGHFGAVTSAVFANESKRLLTASNDGNIKSWSIADEENSQQDVLYHPSAPTSVSFSPDGQLVATGCGDGRIRLWNATSGKLLHVQSGHEGACWRVLFLNSDDQTGLVSTGQDGAVRIWNVDSQVVQQEFPCSANWPVHLPVAASRDGSKLAFANTEFTIEVRDLRRDVVLCHITAGRASDIEFSADGQSLLVAAGNSISVWNATSGESLFNTSTGSRDLACLSVSRDGRAFAAGSRDRTVRLWDIVAGNGGFAFSANQLRVLNGPAGAVWATTYSPDGSMLASSGDDHLIRLWDSVTGEQRAALSGHTASIADLAFSPNGRVLASASDDHTLRLWRAPANLE